MAQGQQNQKQVTKPQPRLSNDDFLQMMLKKAYSKDEPATPNNTKLDPKEIEKLVNDLKAKKAK